MDNRKRFLAWHHYGSYENWGLIEGADTFEELVALVKKNWSYTNLDDVVYTEYIPIKVIDARAITWREEVHNAT